MCVGLRLCGCDWISAYALCGGGLGVLSVAVARMRRSGQPSLIPSSQGRSLGTQRSPAGSAAHLVKLAGQTIKLIDNQNSVTPVRTYVLAGLCLGLSSGRSKSRFATRPANRLVSAMRETDIELRATHGAAHLCLTTLSAYVGSVTLSFTDWPLRLEVG